MVGASLEERDEEEDAASVTSDHMPPKEGVWKVSGTLKNPEHEKPEWVHEILQVRLVSFALITHKLFTLFHIICKDTCP